MINQITKYGATVLLPIFLLGCGYTKLEETQSRYVPIFRIEGLDLRAEMLSPIEIYEDSSKIPYEYIITGTISTDETAIPFPFNSEQDERLYKKLIHEALLTGNDAISNILYFTKENHFIGSPIRHFTRGVNAITVKYQNNITKTNHIYLRIDLREPALITIILYDLQGKVVASPYNSRKQYAEWGPVIFYEKNLPVGYYRLYTKGVHYYNDVVLWEKSKWIRRNKN